MESGSGLIGYSVVSAHFVWENIQEKAFTMGPVEPRDPESGDLLNICKALNEMGAKYIVIGGMAVVYHGFHRGTEDIDLLVERTADNIARLKKSLSILPDNAVQEMKDSDLDEYGTVRIADEVVVDLMSSACGIDFAQASSMVEVAEINGVRIPFASPELLLQTKQTVGEKDEIDRIFLKRLLSERGHS